MNRGEKRSGRGVRSASQASVSHAEWTLVVSSVWGAQRAHRCVGFQDIEFEIEVSVGNVIQASGVMWAGSVDWGVASTEIGQSPGSDRAPQGGRRRGAGDTTAGGAGGAESSSPEGQ